MTRRRMRAECLAIALLSILVTVPFVDVLFGAGRFYVRDLSRFYYPTKKILREIVRSGEFPYWNRYYAAGQPIAANPEYEVFYPPQWLILLPDYDVGYRLHILVHVYIAAIGMYGLLRAMRLRISASLLGAIVFAIGGMSASYINLLPIYFCVVWVPWIGLTLLRALRRPSAARIATAGLVVGIQALVAEPTTLAQTWMMAIVLALWYGWRNKSPRELGRCLAVVGAALALGGLIGLVQLGPAIDHVGDSVRSRPFSLGLMTTWSMPPVRPLELFFPNAFGHLFGKGTYWAGGMYRNTSSPFIYSVYLGLPIAVFAVAAFATSRRGRLTTALIALGSMTIALGEHTPLFSILHELGVAHSVRYPEKFIFPALFAINVFGAVGFDRFLRRDRNVRRIVLGTLLVLTTLASIMTVVMFSPLGARVFETVWRIRTEPRLASVLALARTDWFFAMIRAGALGTLLWTATRRVPRFWRTAMIVFVLVDLVPVGRGVLPRIPKEFYTPPPVASVLDPDSTSYRIFHEADWYGGSGVANQYLRTGGGVYWVIRNGMFPMTTASWGFQTVLERDYDKTALLPTVDLVAATWQVRAAGQARWREIFGAMSNARYRTRYRSFDEERRRVEGRFEISDPVEFIEIASFTPRYYFAADVEQLRQPGEFVSRLVRERFSPRIAFVDFPEFEPAEASVIEVNETANTAKLIVESAGRAFLVMSVTRHKYWSVWIDGEPAKLEPVNVAYQGVIVGKGRHEVVMRYRNPLIPRLGMLSGATAAGCILLLVIPFVRRSFATVSH